MSKSCLPETLIAAYRSTRYRVFANPDFELVIGQPSTALRRLFQESGAQCAAFITAWNPEGQLLAESDNQRAFACLRDRVTPVCVSIVSGFGEDPDGVWAGEESLLALGLSRAASCDIGSEFKQNAIVWAGADCVPELILLR